MWNRFNKFLGLLIVTNLVAWCSPDATRGQQEELSLEPWPDISSPGIDLGDFPNSSSTLPGGTWQLELAPFCIAGRDQYNRPSSSTLYLLRYGVTDDVEFRLLGDGFTTTYDDAQSTGFSPVVLDTKIHLWDQMPEQWIPGTSLEILLSTDWGSKDLTSGYQPTIALNFDLPLTEKLSLGSTIGYGQVQQELLLPNSSQVLSQNVNQAYFQWSVVRELNDRWSVFVTGQSYEKLAGDSAGTLLAFGGNWQQSDRVVWYSLMGWGVTPDAPAIIAQIGLGIAFGQPRRR